MSAQIIELNGVPAFAVAPVAEWNDLLARLEEVQDIADAKAARDSENFPAQFADRLLSGESPLRIWRDYRGFRFLITDGVKYLADNAGCYWLLDAAASHLIQLGCRDHFVLVRLVVKDQAAVLTLEDGNGRLHCKQAIPYTDFPLSQQTLYACWDGEHWGGIFI